MFKIDFKRLVALLLPMSMRTPLVYCILRAAAREVERVYGLFTDARAAHNFRLTHNGQVCYLRAALNEAFGQGFAIGSYRRKGKWLFAVTENGEDIPVAVTEEGHGVPVLYSEQMLNMAQNDFVVYCPAEAYDHELENIKAMVDRYKLVTKRATYVRVLGNVTGTVPSRPRDVYGPIAEIMEMKQQTPLDIIAQYETGRLYRN